ncbi:hypothetical protein [Pseudalkalibacillus caeni]|uniref:Uncharacterized protein n=1 Tax=Exobacillus caeni TaxID=2574798 RepID=A0A5R9F8C8_9BACL|nr:hypothetical protein [Pseudalkalibacillus caeni]TLS35985.1 hypothetical protein FCL54_17485 [Pseudalkalibacillus caeni]
MLTFEEKLAVIESFPELKRKDVSLGRVNFHYEDSAIDKKNVVYHLHPNGNGFVYAELIGSYKTDERGMVNIRDFSERRLHRIIELAIESMASDADEKSVETDFTEERWVNAENHSLMLVKEEDLWNVYAGLNLDGTFTTYGEATEYLEEEGFRRA